MSKVCCLKHSMQHDLNNGFKQILLCFAMFCPSTLEHVPSAKVTFSAPISTSPLNYPPIKPTTSNIDQPSKRSSNTLATAPGLHGQAAESGPLKERSQRIGKSGADS